MVIAIACPTQNVARQVHLASGAYARISGHVLGSRKFSLSFKLSATGAVVVATCLAACDLWPILSQDIAAWAEVVHLRCVRKVTGEFRSLCESRMSDLHVRIACEVHSAWSLLVCRQLGLCQRITNTPEPHLRAPSWRC